MDKVIKAIRKVVRRTGYDIKRHIPGELGVQPFEDMKHFLKGVSKPVIFDVGANIGQTVGVCREVFPDSLIHAFEPSPATYARLSERCHGMEGVKTWQCGVGSREGTLPFSENENSDMSSFLSPTELCWGKIVKTTNVSVITLDNFARQQKIDYVHIVKSDTQGYDFEVLKGADGLMRENRIGMLYFEFIFSSQYKDLPLFEDVLQFLRERNFSLVAIYKGYFQRDLIGWGDVLFISDESHRRFGERIGFST